MNVFLSGLFLLLLAFLIHLVVWKIRLPKRQTPALLWVFFDTYFFAILFLELILPAQYHSSLLPQNFLEYVHVFLFFTSFTLAYIITYSALEVDSPSLLIVKRIADAGPNGLDKDLLSSQLSDDILITPRIHDLFRDKMAVWKGGKIHLTSKGKWFVRIFIAYRMLLNAQWGG